MKLERERQNQNKRKNKKACKQNNKYIFHHSRVQICIPPVLYSFPFRIVSFFSVVVKNNYTIIACLIAAYEF